MPAKKYRVKLTGDERNYLKQLISKGKVSARKIIHANVLIHADEAVTGSLKDKDIAKAIHISRLRLKEFASDVSKRVWNPHSIPKCRQGAEPRNWMGKPKPF